MNIASPRGERGGHDGSGGTDASSFALHKAIRRRANMVELKKLIANYSAVERDTDGQTALHVACQMDARENQVEIVRALLHRAAKTNSEAELLNATDNNGWTALHGAASAGLFDLCELLLGQRHCRAQIGNKDGNAPLLYAVRYRDKLTDKPQYLRVLGLMLEKGADLNAKNKFGEVPLHYACLAANNDAARFLLNQGADVNMSNRLGETSLHYAVRSNKESLVRLLMEYGADPNLGTENSQSPLQVAMSKNMTSMVRMLSSSFEPRRERNPKSDLTPSNMYKDAIKTGNLVVLKHTRKNKWQRAFMIVKEDFVYHFHSPLDKVPVHTFDCSQSTVTEIASGKYDRGHCFELSGPNESCILSVKSENHRTEWINTLQEVFDRATSGGDGSSKLANSIWKHNPGEAMNEDTQAELRSQLATLMRCEPENRWCADCSRPGPMWVSCALGVFVCVECAGVHRDLNMLVKSVFLDQWSQRQIQRIRSMGNAKSNHFYEIALSASYPHVPLPSSPRAEKETFIRQKYIKKAFTSKKSQFVDPKRFVDAQLLRRRARTFATDYTHTLSHLLKRLCLEADVSEFLSRPLRIALLEALSLPNARSEHVAARLKSCEAHQLGSNLTCAKVMAGLCLRLCHILLPPRGNGEDEEIISSTDRVIISTSAASQDGSESESSVGRSSSFSASERANARSRSRSGNKSGKVRIHKNGAEDQDSESSSKSTASASPRANHLGGSSDSGSSKKGRKRGNSVESRAVGRAAHLAAEMSAVGRSSSTNRARSSSGSKKRRASNKSIFCGEAVSPQWTLQLEGALEVYRQHMSRRPDEHASLIFSWWLPQLLELVSMATAAHALHVGDGSEPDLEQTHTRVPLLVVLARAFRESTATALYLLSGDYLPDQIIMEYLELENQKASPTTAEVQKRINDLLTIAKPLCQRLDGMTNHCQKNQTLQEASRPNSGVNLITRPVAVHQPLVVGGSYLLDILRHRNAIAKSLESVLLLVPARLCKALLGVERRGTQFFETSPRSSQLSVDLPLTSSRDLSLRKMMANVAIVCEFLKVLSQCVLQSNHLSDSDGGSGSKENLSQSAVRNAEACNYLLRQVCILWGKIQRLRREFSPRNPLGLETWRYLFLLATRVTQELAYLAHSGAPKLARARVTGLFDVHLRWTATHYFECHQPDNLDSLFDPSIPLGNLKKSS